MASPGNMAMLELIAKAQAVEQLKQQNAAAAQQLAAQLQSLAAQAQARDLVAQHQRQCLAAATAVGATGSSASAPTVSLAPAAAAARAAAVAAAAASAAPASASSPSGSSAAIAAAAAAAAASAAAGGHSMRRDGSALANPSARPPRDGRSHHGGAPGHVSRASAGSAAAAAAAAQAAQVAHAAAQAQANPSYSSAALAAAAAAREATKEAPEEEVARCHLHRKASKNCKFCKAYSAWQERKQKRIEERKSAALEKFKEFSSWNIGNASNQDEKAPLPNFVYFPQVMVERIQKNDFFNTSVSGATLQDLKGVITACETCDTESRPQKAMDLEPSHFISSVYRMLTMQLTEGQIQNMLNSRSCWARCAGYVYIRMGMHHERYWELLADALMDDEEFVPFPGRGGDGMSVGQYVEALLTKDKYCDLSLPRIPAATRRIINKRMVLYGQFRRRYAANVEVLERYQEAGLQVEVCSVDGEWCTGETVGSQMPSSRCAQILVQMPDGSEQMVSIGMLICPDAEPGAPVSGDLTRTRGRSSQELLEKYDEQLKDAAVASGKDYCKSSGQHTLRVGGVPFVAGIKRKDLEREDGSDDDSRHRDPRKTREENLEHKAKLAAIESKYCARVVPSQGRGESRPDVDGPERMRLG